MMANFFFSFSYIHFITSWHVGEQHGVFFSTNCYDFTAILVSFILPSIDIKQNKIKINLCSLHKKHGRCWRDDLAVKSTCYSCRRPEFGFQNPCWVAYNCLQLQLQGIQYLPSIWPPWAPAHTYAHTLTQINTYTYINEINHIYNVPKTWVAKGSLTQSLVRWSLLNRMNGDQKWLHQS